jgi:hypothetical protein
MKHPMLKFLRGKIDQNIKSLNPLGYLNDKFLPKEADGFYKPLD